MRSFKDSKSQSFRIIELFLFQSSFREKEEEFDWKIILFVFFFFSFSSSLILFLLLPASPNLWIRNPINASNSGLTTAEAGWPSRGLRCGTRRLCVGDEPDNAEESVLGLRSSEAGRRKKGRRRREKKGRGTFCHWWPTLDRSGEALGMTAESHGFKLSKWRCETICVSIFDLQIKNGLGIP